MIITIILAIIAVASFIKTLFLSSDVRELKSNNKSLVDNANAMADHINTLNIRLNLKTRVRHISHYN